MFFKPLSNIDYFNRKKCLIDSSKCHREVAEVKKRYHVKWVKSWIHKLQAQGAAAFFFSLSSHFNILLLHI